MSHKFKNLSPDEAEAIAQQFLIDSWSYSKVTQFARNEKAFEMLYVYNYKSKMSASTIAGSAYHAALEAYFNKKKDGYNFDIVDMEGVAFQFIEGVGANQWKLQKTTPTITDCIQKATASANTLLRNFAKEADVYDFKKIYDVELYIDEYITVNGVDIPLPVHCKVDLVVQTADDKMAIVDHKSKAAFTSEEEMKLSVGKQAITYVIAYEAKTGITVDEVWFVENKTSQNKDKSEQLIAFKVVITPDTRRLYEALLYEPLRRMLQAVNDADYVYLINDSDNLVDMAELHEFWAKTMISEIDDFDVPESKKEILGKRLKKIRDASIGTITPTVIKNFRENANKFIKYDYSDKDMTQKEKIERSLGSFGCIVNVEETFEGYSSNTALLSIGAGVKISSIHSHKLDIANALNVKNVRMSKDLVVHNGKSYLSVEYNSAERKLLSFKPEDLKEMKIPIGRDNFENVIYWDLDNQSTPHMLVCGATGSGKSVMLLSTIEFCKLAGVTEIILLDPKNEFENLKSSSIQVYNEYPEIEEQLEFLVMEMNERKKTHKKSKILVIIDEFADAVDNCKKGKDLDVYKDVPYMTKTGIPKVERVFSHRLKSIEENIKMLTQTGRSLGFRVIAATQRASTKIITGDAKVNFPVQVCFRVPKAVDSTVVIGEPGAESLTDKGDGLMKSPQYNDIVRFQGYFKD